MYLRRILMRAILSLIACGALTANSFGEGPKTVFSEREHDFGKVWQGKGVTHNFKLKNSGEADLKIEKIEIADRSTRVQVKGIIPPGHEEEVIIALDTRELIGDVNTSVILHTNDRVNPNPELRMRGQVNPVIGVYPMDAVFFTLYQGQTKERSLTIVNHYDQPIRITKVESSSSRFTAKLETIKEGKEYKLHVRVNPGSAPGRTMEKAILVTDSVRKPELAVGVNIFMKRDVYNFPDQVDFGVVNLEELRRNPGILGLLRQTVLVKRREGKGKDFHVTLKHDIPFISITKEPESGSEIYRLDVSLLPEKLVKGKIESFIRVLTNDKEVPEIKIPVAGEFR